jgi:hypothetical protein
MTHSKKLPRVHAIAVSAISVCTLMLLAGFAPSSSAAVHSRASGPAASTATPALKGVGPTIITCTAKANNPHNSTHVGGTVNFVGSINCTAPVAALHMTLTLSFDGFPVGSIPKSNAGRASISNNVAAACSSGGWQGSTVGTVIFPPGYTPHSGPVFASNEQSISC